METGAQLTKAEEQIMQVLWKLEEGSVSDIREGLEEPKPARTTVATVLSILEKKGFVSHESVGRNNIYRPLLQKDIYSKTQLFGLLKNYFNDSFAAMASFFAKESNYSIEELDKLIRETKEDLDNENKKEK